MLGIQVNGRFLELAPGSAAQLKRNNPFLTKDKIDGEYSLPVSIDYTENNCEILGFVFNYYTRRQKTTVEAILYNGTAMAYRGRLVLETMEGNINSPQSAVIGGYFLTGVSQFLYLVKDTLLKDVDMGTRTFSWTTNAPFDGSNGFWQHAHSTWYTDQYGYVFYPVKNESFGAGLQPIDYMNKLVVINGGYQLGTGENYLSLCPHLYLVFVLRRLFDAYSYTLTGDVLDDPDFKKLTIVSFKAIDWANGVNMARPSVSFKIAEHLPPSWKITDLLIELQQYFACVFVIDPVSRSVELSALKTLRTGGRRKDWTDYAEPALKSSFADDKKKYAIKTTIGGDDSFGAAAFDATGLDLLPPVQTHAEMNLYTNALNVGKYCYVFRDNAWYQLQGTWPFVEWVPMYYNIASYEPTGYTDSFESNVSTMPMTWEVTKSNQSNVPDRYKLLPACSQEGNWPGKQGVQVKWGFRLLFYRGMAREYMVTNIPIPGPGNFSQGIPYPYATHTVEDALGSSIITGLWALPMVYQRPGAGYDYGVVAYWWRQWLDCLESAGEVMTFTLWLPRYELQQHRWTDIILIRNVPYLVQSFTEDLPYPDYVQAELLRIG